MEEGLFDYQDYKKYLLEKIQRMPRSGRGFRAQMARELRCQTAFISQVLKGHLHFGLEQGLVLSRIFAHTEDERRYFILLIEMARASSSELQKHFQKQLEELRSRQTSLKERFKSKLQLGIRDSLTYYSNWLYVALHVMSSIPRFQTPLHLANKLKISESVVKEMLQDLIELGLVRLKDGKYLAQQSRIHLGSDSPLISKHHLNWRLQAMQTISRPSYGAEKNLHYTSVVSLSKKDAEKLRKFWISAMEEHNKLVSSSPEEVGYCLAFDFFEVEG